MAKPSEASKILYIGEDGSYWEVIKGRLSANYQQTEFEFIKLEVDDYNMYQSNFLKILDIFPGIIYIDFSQYSDSQLKLAQLIARENKTKNIPMVGLVEKSDDVKKGLTVGADFIHVKCGEYHDVIYDAFYLAYPKEAIMKDFATAKFSREVKLIDDFRIGYIAPTHIHAEGNIELKKGQVIELDSAIPNKIVPSRKFVVKSIGNSHLYYDYKYCYDLEFVFVDEPEFEEDEQTDALGEDDPERRRALIKEAKDKRKHKIESYQEELTFSKKKTKKWVEENIDLTALKKTKILIVDHKLRVLEDEKPIDEYSYSIRTQTFLTESLNELTAIRPDIIAFQFRGDEMFEEPVDENGEPRELLPEEIEARRITIEEAENDDMKTLSAILKYIKKQDKYKPFLVLFNCHKFSSKAFQDSFKYPLVITHVDKIHLPVIINMANMYEERQQKSFEEKVQKKIAALRSKDPRKYGRLTTNYFLDKHYYIRKTNPLSHVSYSYPIELTSLNESSVEFLADTELDLKSFRMDFPIPMAIHLVPDKEGQAYGKGDGGRKIYTGLIHCTDEDDKKELRQYVNEIFFTPLMEQREKENEEFKKVQEQALQEKEAEEQIEDEEIANDSDKPESISDDSSNIDGSSQT